MNQAHIRHSIVSTILLAITWSLPTIAAGTAGQDKTTPSAKAVIGTSPLTITSGAFQPQGDIPTVYTCQGKDLSPPLSWKGVPNNAQSLVLIVDDPDAPDPLAPKMIWVHWVLYNIPAMASGLPEGVVDEKLPPMTLLGKNDWKKTGYKGPCPPTGRHRYFHKVYALDVVLPDLNMPIKAQLEQAMKGHIVGQGELIGTYEKAK
jgi:Raf kinase inhibitor-like YbhB/YbcL family protein